MCLVYKINKKRAEFRKKMSIIWTDRQHYIRYLSFVLLDGWEGQYRTSRKQAESPGKNFGKLRKTTIIRIGI